jgi:outer membrane receptor protein involved in Fe transport
VSVARFASGSLRLGLPITPEHRVLGGVVGDFTQLTQRSSSTDPRSGAPSPSQSALIDNAGGASASVEYQGDFPLGLHATAGLALEWRDAFPVVLAPRLGVAWDVLDDVRLRATYSEGVRAPDRFDLFSLGTAIVDGRVLGVANNDLLQPEHVRMLDVGVSLQPSADLRFTSRAFALRHESALSTESTGGVLRPENVDPRLVIGAEAGAGVAPLPLSLRGLLRLDGGLALARTLDGPDLAADQLHATLQSSSSPVAGLVLGLRGRARHLLGAAAASPDGAVLDAFFSFDPSSSLSLTLSCANVLDANERTVSTLAQPFSPPATYPGPGRTVALSVEGRF